MKKVLTLLVVSGLVLVLSSGLYANGINLNSIGTKALSMGGAFVGLADDYSAVFWNPAGLTQMKSSNLAIMGSVILPKVTYKFDLVGIDTQTESKIYPNPALGYFHVVSEKLVIGLFLYAPSGIGGKWNGADLTMLTWPDPTVYEWESKIAAFTASPVIAYKVSDAFSIGAALNINYGLLQMKNPGLGQYKEDLDAFFFNATIGALLKPSKYFSVGATIKLPTKFKLKGDAEMSGAPLLGLSATSGAEREVNWPMWIGVGVAIKPCDTLTITADAQYTNWDKIDKFGVTYTDAFWKAVGFELLGTLNTYWENKIQYRFGIQYMVSDAFALRAGYYYDPAPSPATTLNILLPSITSHWVTFGIGYSTEKINLDLGFEYNLGGQDRDADILSPDAMPGTHGLAIFVPTVALTFKF